MGRVRNHDRYPVLLAAIVLACLAAGIASGAVLMGSYITYQGRLTDGAGNPLTGTYPVKFTVYDLSTGGTALNSYTADVTATNGLFTTEIPFGDTSENVDGRPLRLGIKVGSDPEMSPRQTILPVPYALSLRPGAWITSVTATPALILKNTGGGKALQVTTTGYGSNGIWSNSVGDASQGFVARMIGEESPGFYADTAGLHSAGVYAHTTGAGSAGVHAETSAWNSKGMNISTTGDDSDGVYVRTSGSGSSGMNVETRDTESPGILVKTFSANSPAISAYSSADVGISAATDGPGMPAILSRTNHRANEGMRVLTSGILADGINITTTGDVAKGIAISTTGVASNGVSINTSGSWTTGVNVNALGVDSRGVVVRTTGIQSHGVAITTDGDHSGGVSAITGGYDSDGVFSATKGDNSPGVHIQTTGEYSKGVDAFTWGYDNTGVNVTTRDNYSEGIEIHTAGFLSNGLSTTTRGPNSDAIYAGAYGSSSRGVNAYSSSYYGVYAETGATDHKYGLFTPDYIYTKGTQVPAADIAEYMPVDGDAPPGTVLVISEDRLLRPSAAAYDTRVAGIVSTDPGVSLGTKDDGNPGEALVAVAGRVPCRVDAGYGAIRAGDVLATSPTPGYAMKAEPLNISGVEIYKPSTVLGKAMGSLESGTGTIEVLVTLQ